MSGEQAEFDSLDKLSDDPPRLLVSEAELAEALAVAVPATMVGVSTDFNRGADAPAEPPSRWYVADDQRLAAAIFAALAKQQEDRER